MPPSSDQGAQTIRGGEVVATRSSRVRASMPRDAGHGTPVELYAGDGIAAAAGA
jgi:hypothetical protein